MKLVVERSDLQKLEVISFSRVINFNADIVFTITATSFQKEAITFLGKT
jgi:hypothetical protein